MENIKSGIYFLGARALAFAQAAVHRLGLTRRRAHAAPAGLSAIMRLAKSRFL